jgi:hypothetical protein
MSEYTTVLHLHKSPSSPLPVGPVYEFPGSKVGIVNTTDDRFVTRAEKGHGDHMGAPPALQAPCRYAATAQGVWLIELNDWEKVRHSQHR